MHCVCSFNRSTSQRSPIRRSGALSAPALRSQLCLGPWHSMLSVTNSCGRSVVVLLRNNKWLMIKGWHWWEIKSKLVKPLLMQLSGTHVQCWVTGHIMGVSMTHQEEMTVVLHDVQVWWCLGAGWQWLGPCQLCWCLSCSHACPPPREDSCHSADSSTQRKTSAGWEEVSTTHNLSSEPYRYKTVWPYDDIKIQPGCHTRIGVNNLLESIFCLFFHQVAMIIHFTILDISKNMN